MERLVQKGGISHSGAQPATWTWFKDKLKETYQPAEREELLKDHLSTMKQEEKESIQDYHAAFTYISAQLTLSPTEEFDYFQRGLRAEYRDMLRDAQWTRRSLVSGLGSYLNLPAGSKVDVGSLSISEAMDLCLRKEEGDALKAASRRREQQLHSSSSGYRGGYNRGMYGNRGAATAGGQRSYGGGAGSSRHQPIHLSALESNRGMDDREEGELLATGEGTAEGMGEHGSEGEGPGYELNAVGSAPSAPVRANPPRDSNSSSQSAGAANEPRCWNCGKAGHLKKDCKLPLQQTKTNGSGGAGKNARGAGKA